MELTVRDDRRPITLRNEIEASLVDAILREDGIPHFVKSYHDRAYDGIFQFQRGWGCVDAPPEYRLGIRALLQAIRHSP